MTMVYAALPVLLAACGVLRKKAPACLLCGIFLFVFLLLAGVGDPELHEIYRLLPQYPVSLVYRLDAPIGFLFPAKLLSMLFPEPFLVTPVFSAIFACAVTRWLYRYCEAPVFGALLAAAGGFLFTAVRSPCLFAAVLLCAFAFRYASERRFLRFAALVLLASCFSFDAVLLLALYPVLLLPPRLWTLFAGAGVSALLLLSGAPGLLFQYMYGEAAECTRPGLSSLVPAVFCVFCLWAALMKPMLGGKREFTDTMILSLFSAAFLSLNCVYEIQLFPLMLICAFPAVLALGGSLLKASARLISLTFREKKKAALAGFTIFGLALLGIWYGWLLTQNAAALGL